ncbi:MAG: hypothetical protein HWQ41_25110 [Nostoc sp. NOS(2021)]|uniref:hypothetical protein n=1 Tax=Nostoc sp. NOS(2021) TaxID=2815407 RepID=UPI0025E156F7|nr:hypothetical protein [Nostoc sp. NOS(2021)]MBN3898430.1 hypothetical protein [Nostoc sp. NOS(2021)]
MFTRSELEIKTIKELSELCLRYGIKPTGNKGYKTSWITSLMVFPRMALSQFEAGKGLKPPTFAFMQALSNAIDEINAPTDEQAALIKITMEGRIMNYPDRYTQEKLLALHKAKMYLELALGLLSK